MVVTSTLSAVFVIDILEHTGTVTVTVNVSPAQLPSVVPVGVTS